MINKIVEKGDDLILRMMEVSLFLDMDSLRRRLACGVALKVMCCTVEELREEYELPDSGFDE